MSPPAFTLSYGRVADALVSDVRVKACMPSGSRRVLREANLRGLWDTGSTNSVITRAVVTRLRLTPVDVTRVRHAHGWAESEVYIVDVTPPGCAVIPMLKVTRGVLWDFDMLIGMDVIGRGDFAVSNFNGMTSFTFRLPSAGDADYERGFSL